MRIDKLILIQIQFPEHPFALVVARPRALGRPATARKLIDGPEIPLAVRVVVLVEGVKGFDQFADTPASSGANNAIPARAVVTLDLSGAKSSMLAGVVPVTS